MKRRMTGGCGLPSKLLTIALLSISATSWAVDNSIYIDQAGSNATVSILQDGAGNRVKGIVNGTAGQTTDAAKIYGDGTQLAISQIGAGNSLALGITSDYVSGNSATVRYSVTGGGNTGLIDLNNAGVSGGNSNSLVDISQTGGGNNATISMLGTGNSLTATMSGGSATLNSTVNAAGTSQTITTSGGTANSVTTNLTGDKGSVDVTLQGASNTVSVTQTGGGANGHVASINVNGSGNSVTTSQGGSNDTTINLRSVGSGNTFNVTTH